MRLFMAVAKTLTVRREWNVRFRRSGAASRICHLHAGNIDLTSQSINSRFLDSGQGLCIVRAAVAIGPAVKFHHR